MTILDRNIGTFNTAASINVTRSTGVYGTGTRLVVAVFGNTIFTTPSGWTQRHTSVATMGLYAYDKPGAGESSLTFTCSPAGSGVWAAWELSAGSDYLTGNAQQQDNTLAAVTTATLTPSAGNRHLLVVAGGIHPSATRSVTGFNNSFTNFAAAAALNQDRPFAGRVDRDVTTDGSVGYNTTATFDGLTLSALGSIFLAYADAAGDSTPPATPAGLAVGTVTSTTAALSWSAATDNIGVTGYEVQVTKV